MEKPAESSRWRDVQALLNSDRTDEEALWCEWISRMPVWARRIVYRHEMEWHDEWVNGNCTLTDLRLKINAVQHERYPHGQASDA